MNRGPCGALLQVDNGQPADSGAVSGAQYRAPAGSNLCWENPHSDPYSVLNVFSRQQRYGARGEWLEGGGRLWHCLCTLLFPQSLRSDMTFAVDWVLNYNYLSILDRFL